MDYEAPVVVAVTPVNRPLVGTEAISVGSNTIPGNPQWHDEPEQPRTTR